MEIELKVAWLDECTGLREAIKGHNVVIYRCREENLWYFYCPDFFVWDHIHVRLIGRKGIVIVRSTPRIAVICTKERLVQVLNDKPLDPPPPARKIRSNERLLRQSPGRIS